MKNVLKVVGLIVIVILLVLFVWAVTSRDVGGSSENDNLNRAEREWEEMDPVAREVVCDIYERGNLKADTDYDEQKLRVMEEECDS